jgi:hypothetical protein
VATGIPYKLAFQTFVGTAFAGQTFARSPAVAIVDRGGNVVTNSALYIDPDEVGAGTIRAELTACPSANLCPDAATRKSQLQPAINTVAAVSEGVATFQGLYLNVSGYPYEITFYSGMVSALPWHTAR